MSVATSRFLILCVCSLWLSSMAPAQLPGKASYIAAARLVSRGFHNIDGFDGRTSAASGFVTYAEITSQPAKIDATVLEMLTENYKPGEHATGPLTPPTKAVIIFDKERRAIWLIGLFDDSRVTLTDCIEVDVNCYQGNRKDEKSCTIDNSQLAEKLREFVLKHEVLPADIGEWKKGKVSREVEPTK